MGDSSVLGLLQQLDAAHLESPTVRHTTRGHTALAHKLLIEQLQGDNISHTVDPLRPAELVFALRCVRRFDDADRLEQLLHALPALVPAPQQQEGLPQVLHLLVQLTESVPRGRVQRTPAELIRASTAKLPDIFLASDTAGWTSRTPDLPERFMTTSAPIDEQFGASLFADDSVLPPLELPSENPSSATDPFLLAAAPGSFLSRLCAHPSGTGLFGAPVSDTPSRNDRLQLPSMVICPGMFWAKKRLLEKHVSSSIHANGNDDDDDGEAATRDCCERFPSVTQLPPAQPSWEHPWPKTPLHQRVFLSEAGSRAFDLFYRVHRQAHLLDNTPIPVLPLAEARHAICHALTGVPSSLFPFSADSCALVAHTGIRIENQGLDATTRVLAVVAQAGTALIHLERVCKFYRADTCPGGLTRAAFASAVFQYLVHYRTHLSTALERHAESGLLELLHAVSPLTKQLIRVAKLCQLDPSRPLNPASLNVLPAAQDLIHALLTAVSANELLPDSRVFLCLLQGSLSPYLSYLRDWAYDGVLTDPHGEFEISIHPLELSERNQAYWLRGFELDERAATLRGVLSSQLLAATFSCGKSINLLRICCPGHYLFDPNLPTVAPALAFSSLRIKQLEDQAARFHHALRFLEDRHAHNLREHAEAQLEQRQQLLRDAVQRADEAEAAKTEFEEKRRRKTAESKAALFKALQDDIAGKAAQKEADRRREAAEEHERAQIYAHREHLVDAEAAFIKAQYDELSRIQEERASLSPAAMAGDKVAKARNAALAARQSLVELRLRTGDSRSASPEKTAPSPLSQEQQPVVNLSARERLERFKQRKAHEAVGLFDMQRAPDNDTPIVAEDARGQAADSDRHRQQVIRALSTMALEPVDENNHEEHRSASPTLMQQSPPNSPSFRRGTSDVDFDAPPGARGVSFAPDVVGPPRQRHAQESSLTALPDASVSHGGDVGSNPSSRRASLPGPGSNASSRRESVQNATSASGRPGVISDPESESEPEPEERLPFEAIYESPATPPSSGAIMGNTWASGQSWEQAAALSSVMSMLPSDGTAGVRRRLWGVISESSDSEDANAAAEAPILPVQEVLNRCVIVPLERHIQCVNRAVYQYFVHNLKLWEHLEAIRRFILMHSGEFGEALVHNICIKLQQRAPPLAIANTALLQSALAHSSQDGDPLSGNLHFYLCNQPAMPFKHMSIFCLDFLDLRYQVKWPLNIVIDAPAQALFNRAFSFLLKLKRVGWMLHGTWIKIRSDCRSVRNDPEANLRMRKAQGFRHEMQHFVTVMSGYVSREVSLICWDQFVEDMKNSLLDVDGMRSVLYSFLDNMLFRALLNDKAAPVMKIILGLLDLIMRFCAHVSETVQVWESDEILESLQDIHRKFNKYLELLVTVATKLASRGYEAQLEDFLLLLNFNFFYRPPEAVRSGL
eukprot:m.24906 g.24906  ORF g.24906 m.24906 type:complete len:1426 (+) comp4360_c0_seq1:105-4382(+)